MIIENGRDARRWRFFAGNYFFTLTDPNVCRELMTTLNTYGPDRFAREVQYTLEGIPCACDVPIYLAAVRGYADPSCHDTVERFAAVAVQRSLALAITSVVNSSQIGACPLPGSDPNHPPPPPPPPTGTVGQLPPIVPPPIGQSPATESHWWDSLSPTLVETAGPVAAWATGEAIAALGFRLAAVLPHPAARIAAAVLGVAAAVGVGNAIDDYADELARRIRAHHSLPPGEYVRRPRPTIGDRIGTLLPGSPGSGGSTPSDWSNYLPSLPDLSLPGLLQLPVCASDLCAPDSNGQLHCR